VAQLIVKAGLVKSGKEAKRLIAENGARLNDTPISEAGQIIEVDVLKNTIKLSAGKKRHAIVGFKT
jgi:tyrosyl-tRNA synthetase